ncbi:MAG: hypothetical protein ACRCW1_00605 [Anaerotignaceae bacterium]
MKNIIKELIKGLTKTELDKKELIKIYTKKFHDAYNDILQIQKDINEVEDLAKEKNILHRYIRVEDKHNVRNYVYQTYTYETEKTGIYFDFNAYYCNWNYTGDIYKKQCSYKDIVGDSMERYIEHVIKQTYLKRQYFNDKITATKSGYKIDGKFIGGMWNKVDDYEIKTFFLLLFRFNHIPLELHEIEVSIEKETITIQGETIGFTVQKNGKMILK